MNRILFICHGNICRSTMAEFVMKDKVKKAGLSDEFRIDSKATSREEIGNDTHYGTKRILDREGITYSPRKAAQVTASDYDHYDLLVIMDEENRRGLMRIIGSDPEGKVHKLMEYAGESRDVADPWYTGDFDVTYDDVDRGCDGILKELTEK